MEKRKYILALGFFDGAHLGHQALLTAGTHLAERAGCDAGAVIFTSHPDTLVAGRTPPLINTVQERKRLLLGYGVSGFLELPFDRAMMNMHWQTFLEMLLDKGAAGFVCGDDFRFGKGGEGNACLLAQFCRERELPYAVVPEQTVDGARVSSTRIRALIEGGKMAEAARLLGHPHILSGTVVPGRQLGRTIGIPTANLALPDGVICPAFGVYACRAVADGREYMAVTNVGVRPTVSGSGVTVEPWLLDFDSDLYGKELTLEFYAFLRPERKFDSLEELQAEIRKNAGQTRKFFEKV